MGIPELQKKKKKQKAELWPIPQCFAPKECEDHKLVHTLTEQSYQECIIVTPTIEVKARKLTGEINALLLLMHTQSQRQSLKGLPFLSLPIASSM